MENKKLRFTTHEVNELIGGVPKKLLWYCAGILLATVLVAALMVSITPYPKNMRVQAQITQATSTPNLADNGSGNLICRLQFNQHALDQQYLKNIKNITISFSTGIKRYRFKGTVINTRPINKFIIAEVQLNDKPQQRELLQSERQLLQQPLMVELINDRFTIKDKIESKFHTN